MIIKSLEIENIRSYKKTKANFDYGINFLSGDIGSGKSSLLLSIEFALLGFKKGDLEANQLLRKGEKEGYVSLLIFDDINNIEIEILRKLKKTKNSESISQEECFLRIGENLIELSPQELNARIFEILNLPKEFLTKDKNLIYRYTTYTAQDELKEIIYASSEKRLEVIRKIFGIDKYKVLRDAITIYSQKNRESKKEFQTRLEELNNLNKETEEKEKVLIEIRNKLLELKPKKEIVIEQLNKINTLQKKIEDNIEKENKNQQEIEKELVRIEEELKQINKIKITIKEKEEQLEKENIENLKSTLIEERNRLDEITKSKERLKDEENKEKLELRRIEEEVKKELEEEINIEKKRNILNERIKRDEYILNQCKIKDLEKEEEKRNSLTKKLLSSEKKRDELTEENIKLELELKQIETRLKELNNKHSEIEHKNTCDLCEQEINKEHKKLLKEKKNKEEKELTTKLNNYQERKKDIEKDLKKITKDIESIRIEKEENTKTEEKLRFLKEKIVKDKLEHDEINKERTKLIVEEEKYISKYKTNNKTLENPKNKLIEVRTRIDELNKKKEDLNTKDTIVQKKVLALDLKIKQIHKDEKEIELNKIQIKKEEGLVILRTELIKNKEDKVKLELENKKKLLEIKKKKEEGEEKEKIINTRLTQLETQRELYEEQQKQIKMKITSLDKIKELYNQIISEESFLNKELLPLLISIERTLFTKYYVEFNEHFERYFKDLIEDKEIEIRLDEEFSPKIEQNGYDTEVRNLSGGEKSSLALAYRLGLKKIIENNKILRNDIETLILDEPTEGFSSEQINRLGLLLRETEIKQIILVSHDEKIESIADKVLKVEKTNHISEII